MNRPNQYHTTEAIMKTAQVLAALLLSCITTTLIPDKAKAGVYVGVDLGGVTAAFDSSPRYGYYPPPVVYRPYWQPPPPPCPPPRWQYHRPPPRHWHDDEPWWEYRRHHHRHHRW